MKMLFRRVSKLSRVRKSSRGQSSRRRRVTRFEALESRQLLAADITGAVYNDLNGDGVHNNGEVGLANWTVFLDLDSNGNLDAGEPSSLTDADGKYAFRGVTAGDYRVAEVVRTGWVATNPATAFTDVTVVDGTGRVVWSRSAAASGLTLEVSGWAAGWYRAEVATSWGQASVQLLVR